MATITDRDIIKGTDVPAMIAHAISGQLGKFTSFANPSLCYYGIQLKYTLEITTFSRGEEKILATKDVTLLAHEDAPPIPLDATSAIETASGTKMAGRRSPAPKHQPSEGTVVVPALPRVSLQTPAPSETVVLK